MKNIFSLLLLVAFTAGITANAGNPDRKGEAGAYELLINPYARSSGWNGLNVARVQGVEAMKINPAGLAFTRKTELVFAHTRWIVGTDMGINVLGLSQKLGEANVLGVNLMSMDFGTIQRTTVNSPEGGVGEFRPRFYNIGLSFARAFSNSIYAGAMVTLISESIEDVSATGVAIDAGIQYVTGTRDNIRFGIALRNVGTPMTFSGDGLTFRGDAPEGDYLQSLNQRAEKFELPSQLLIGLGYDFYFDTEKESPLHRFTVVGNFTSNSFGRDKFGAGAEYSFKEMFQIRGGYTHEKGISRQGTVDEIGEEERSVYTGLSGGLTIEVPLKDGGPSIGIDYSYRHTNPFSGTHAFGVRINL